MTVNNHESFTDSRFNFRDLAFIIALLLFQTLFVFQGLDFVDEGTFATMYQQIFSYPDTLQFMFHYWLTAVIGGLWLKLFPGLGLLGIWIAGIIVTTFTAAIIYYALKNYITVRNLRAGLFIAIILATYNMPKGLSYNNLSVLFWVSSSVLLWNGLRRNRNYLILLSGILAGLNAFIRLPNLFGCIIVLTLFYYGWIAGRNLRSIITQTLFFIAGTVLGVVLILVIMSMLGHTEIFVKSVAATLSMGFDTEGGHTLAKLTKRIGLHLMTGLSYTGFFLVIAFLYLSLSQFYVTRKNLSFLDVVFIVFFILGVTSFFISGILTSNGLGLFVVGIVILVSIQVLFADTFSIEIRLISLLGILLVVFFPLGSGSGLVFIGRSALILSLPVIVQVIRHYGNYSISFTPNGIHNEEFTLTNNRLSIIPRLFILTTISTGIILNLSTPYNSSSNRMVMRYSIDNAQLKGIYMTKERAQSVDELINAGLGLVNKGDFVLAYDNMPMYHFLTGTRPYLKNPHLGSYNSGMLKKALDEARENIEKLPIVVLQKVYIGDSNWPENTDEVYDIFTSELQRDIYLKDFLDQNNYIGIWENSAFMILKPEDFSK